MADNASLDSLIWFWGWAEDASTSVVALGALGEFVAELTKIIRSRWWKRWLAKASAIVLIVGVVGELVSQHQLSGYNGQLVALINLKAKEQGDRAAQAELALEKLKTPRTLGPDRQKFVVAAIASFSGQRYRTLISQGADDGLAFWESLYVTLKKAGWIYVPLPANAFGMGNPPAGIPIAAMPGVEIRFDPTKESELTPAGLALGNALHADGTVVSVNRDNHSDPNETERNVLLVVIGARVPPP
jgi:hypothetical protein